MNDVISAIPVRHLPGIAGLEAAIRLNRAARVGHDHDLDRRAAEISLEVFGLSAGDTEFPCAHFAPDKPDEEWSRAENDRFAAAERAHWEQFTFLFSDDVDDPHCWDRLGWDVRGEDGHLLECLPFFARQLVAITNGLGGFDRAEIATRLWASRLEANKRPSQSDLDRNRKYLMLGPTSQRSRRTKSAS